MIQLLFRFEIFYQMKQKAFPIFSIMFLLFGVFVSRQGFAPVNVDFNSPYQIMFNTSLFSLGSVFFIIFYTVSAVLRDKQNNMENIIYSTSLSKNNFFISRFSGIFLFSILTFTMFLIGFALGTINTQLDPSRIVEFDFTVYFWIWLILILPNIFILTSVIFCVGLTTKNNIAIYASSVFIYMLYMICSLFLNSPLMAQSVPASPEGITIAALVDPFAISAFFEQTQFWTPIQKNQQLISFSGKFLYNRILWFGISFLLLLVTYHKFSFRKSNQRIKESNLTEQINLEKKKYFTINSDFTWLSNLKSLISIIKIDLNTLIKNLPFFIIILFWSILIYSEMYFKIYEGGAYGDSLYPFTNILIEIFTTPLNAFALILIIFSSSELIWRDRNYSFNEVIDTTPTSNWIFFISKYISLLFIPFIMISLSIIIAIILQFYSGHFDIEIGQYLSVFYYHSAKLYLFIFIAIFFQNITENKYLGMGLTILFVLIFGSFVTPYIGLEHPLVNLNFLQPPTFSNLTGYVIQSQLFNHLTWNWLAFGLLLTLFTFIFWRRGNGINARTRIVESIFTSNKLQITISTLVLVIFISVWFNIFYNTNIVNEYKTSNELLDLKEQYERKYKQYDSLQRVNQISMKTEVDLFPNLNSYSVKAEYILMNKTDIPIKHIFITEREKLKDLSISNGILVQRDSTFGTYLYEFETAIKPGEKIKLEFQIIKRLKGYESSRNIIKNGTYLRHIDFDPYLKYRRGMEIYDNYERAKRGLPPRVDESITDDHLQNQESNFGKIDYETIVSTVSNETAIASGQLIKKWKNNNRNYFQYKPVDKIIPTMAYFSGSYKVDSIDFKGITIEQYYYPQHNQNIEIVFESVKQTLDYQIKNFGDYPYKQIRLVEVPSFWNFGGYAHPGVISLVEDRLYLIDTSDKNKFNLVAKRVIHEVAHQWWGHILSPKIVEGGSLLIEGFAKYSESVIMEKIYGKRALWQLGKTANNNYFSGRAYASEIEPPIYLIHGQSYLTYGKSYSVMLALTELIGEEKINQVIKLLVDKYRNNIDSKITTIEFLEELYKVSPIKYHTLINDWLKKVVFYDLKMQKVSYKKLSNNKYEINLRIRSKKFEVMENNSSKEILINEPITVALFTKHPSKIEGENEIIYSAKTQINKENSEVKIIVKTLPKYAAIDPFGTRIDEDLEDNVFEIVE